MVFNSLTFVVFFALVLALDAMPFCGTTRKVNLGHGRRNDEPEKRV